MSKTTPEKREKQELDRAVKALGALQHNPIDWIPIIKFLAPIVARIAARYVLKVTARKLGRKISSKNREDIVLDTADYISEIAIKRTTGSKKK